MKAIKLQNHRFHHTEMTVDQPERTIFILLIWNIVSVRRTDHLAPVLAMHGSLPVGVMTVIPPVSWTEPLFVQVTAGSASNQHFNSSSWHLGFTAGLRLLCEDSLVFTDLCAVMPKWNSSTSSSWCSIHLTLSFLVLWGFAEAGGDCVDSAESLWSDPSLAADSRRSQSSHYLRIGWFPHTISPFYSYISRLTYLLLTVSSMCCATESDCVLENTITTWHFDVGSPCTR